MILIILYFLINHNVISYLIKELLSDYNIKNKDLDFSDYATTIKLIVIYNSKINFSIKTKIINKYVLYFNNRNKKFNKEINFAKSHGIYGFGFYHLFSYNKSIYD